MLRASKTLLSSKGSGVTQRLSELITMQPPPAEFKRDQVQGWPIEEVSLQTSAYARRHHPYRHFLIPRTWIRSSDEIYIAPERTGFIGDNRDKHMSWDRQSLLWLLVLSPALIGANLAAHCDTSWMEPEYRARIAKRFDDKFGYYYGRNALHPKKDSILNGRQGEFAANKGFSENVANATVDARAGMTLSQFEYPGQFRPADKKLAMINTGTCTIN